MEMGQTNGAKGDDARTMSTQSELMLVGSRGIRLMGVYLAVLPALIIYLLVAAWMPVPNNAGTRSVTWFWWESITVGVDAWLFLIVLLAGGLGGYVHTATSFADYVGNRKLTRSWLWWLLLRAPIGIVLALIFYLVLRGGLLTAIDDGKTLNPYGFAAIAAMVGMFSKQATDKLRELFDTLFKTDSDAGRGDKLTSPQPNLASFEPPTVVTRGSDQVVTAIGANFVTQSVVRIGGESRKTHFKSETRLIFELVDADVATAGQLDVSVINPAPGGGESDKRPLTVV
jgi:hypothetical protein